MEENTMEQNLTRQHNGFKYAFSPAQQVAWSMDFSSSYRDRKTDLENLMTDLDTFKRACVDLKNTQEANAAAGLAGGIAGGDPFPTTTPTQSATTRS